MMLQGGSADAVVGILAIVVGGITAAILRVVGTAGLTTLPDSGTIGTTMRLQQFYLFPVIPIAVLVLHLGRIPVASPAGT